MVLTIILVVLTISAKTRATTDPCSVNQELPRSEYRGGKCDFKGNKGVCDNTIDKAWYRVLGLNGDLQMQNTPAAYLSCGTEYPYWMNGTLPSVAEGEAARQVCQSDEKSVCSKERTIHVKNCTTFYVYQLEPLDNCPTGYCFGKDEQCPPFDPCDVSEHTFVDEDDGSKHPCDSSRRAKCNKFDNNWYVFEKGTGYMNMTSTCPSVSPTCGTRLPLWIKESMSINGTTLNTVCVQNKTSCCASTFKVRSKLCKQYTVYQFPTPSTDTCQGFCLNDKQITCSTTVVPESTTVPVSTVKGDYHGAATMKDSRITLLITVFSSVIIFDMIR